MLNFIKLLPCLIVCLLISFYSNSQIPLNIPQNGLVGYYSFDGNANDIIGSKNGIGYNVSYGIDKNLISNKSIAFSGTNSYVKTSNVVSSSVANNFTISFWAKTTTTGKVQTESNTGNLLNVSSGVGAALLHPTHGGAWGPETENSGIGIFFDKNVIQVIEHSANFVSFPLVYQGSFTDWTLITLVYENKTPKLYVNGVFKKSGLTSKFLNVHPSNGVDPKGYSESGFGQSFKSNFPSWANNFIGSLDDFAIWNRVLNISEISTLYSNCTYNSTKKIFNSNQIIANCGSVYQLSANSGFSKYMWDQGDSTKIISVSKSGLYFCTAKDSCVYLRDSVFVSLPPAKITNSSKKLYKGESIVLKSTFNFDGDLTEYKKIGEKDGHTYYLSNTTATWQDAKLIAESLGGTLFIPNSKDEFDFVFRKVNVEQWIGISDEKVTTEWRDVNGNLINYANWWPGEPNNFGSERHVIVSPNGLWSNWYGNNPRNFVIEFDETVPKPFQATWSSGDLTSFSIVSPTQDTNYVLTVSDGVSSCQDNIIVEVVDKPIVSLNTSTSNVSEVNGSATITASIPAATFKDVVIDLALTGTSTKNADYVFNFPNFLVPELFTGAVDAGYSYGTKNETAFTWLANVFFNKNEEGFVYDSYNNRIVKVDKNGNSSYYAGFGNSSVGPIETINFVNSADFTYDSKGNLFYADMGLSVIKKIDLNGNVTIYAGDPFVPGYKDGASNIAKFNKPGGLFIDKNDIIYVAEQGNHTVRRIDLSGNVTTIAGSPGLTGMVNGPSSQAKFNTPVDVVVDSKGNVYVSDKENLRIRKISADYTEVTTFAGSGIWDDADGQGIVANFKPTGTIVIDELDNIYMTTGFSTKIRKISPMATVTTVLDAGFGIGVFTLAPSGNMYYAGKPQVVKLPRKPQLTIPAGSTTATLSIQTINDKIDEGNETLIASVESVINGVAGNAATITITSDDAPPKLVISGETQVIENGNAVKVYISLENTSSKTITANLALTGTAIKNTNYILSAESLTFAPGDSVKTILITPIDNNLVEVLKTISLTFSGSTNASTIYPTFVASFISDDKPIISIGLDKNSIPEKNGKAILTATLASPTSQDVVIDLKQNGLALNDYDFSFSFASLQKATTFYGNGPGNSINQLYFPHGIFGDNYGNIYVSDAGNNRILKINKSSGKSEIIGGVGNIWDARDLFVLDKDVYVADHRNHRISHFIEKDNKWEVVAGGNGDGNASNQMIYPFGVFVDRNQNVFASDQFGGRIQKWPKGAQEGIMILKNISGPLGLAADGKNNLYVAENGNSRVLQFIQETGKINIVAGNNGIGSALNQLNGVYGLSIDKNNSLYVVDASNHRISKWLVGAKQGKIVAGGNGAGIGENNLNVPASVYVDDNENLYISDKNNHRIQLIQYQPQIVIPAGQTTGTLVIDAIDDVIDEDTEDLILETVSATNATLTNSTYTVNITSDDVPPTLSLELSSGNLEEDKGVVILTGKLNKQAGKLITANLSIAGTAIKNQDYSLSSETLTFAPGDSIATIIFTPINDSQIEIKESILIAITSSTNLNTTYPSASITVISEDNPTLSISLDKTSISEAGGKAKLTFNLNQPTSKNIEIKISTSGVPILNKDFKFKYLPEYLPVLPENIPNHTFLGDLNSHRYFVSQNSLSWSQAADTSNYFGGYLMIPNSLEENTFVRNLVRDQNGPFEYYIGLTDKAVEGTWRDVNGNLLSYTNWSGGEPNNSGGNENYALVYSWGGWNDGGSCCLRYVMEFGDPVFQGKVVIPAGTSKYEISINGLDDFENEPDEIIKLKLASVSNAILSDTLSKSITIVENQISLTKIATPFPALSKSAISWGDYDRDGDQDLAIMGYSLSTGIITRVYRNENGTFVNTNQNLINVNSGDIKWVDINKDGYLDLLYTGIGSVAVETYVGRKTLLYINNKNGGFTLTDNLNLAQLSSSKLGFGDLDNDGDLDLAIMGINSSNQPVFYLYERENNALSYKQITDFYPNFSQDPIDWDLKVSDIDLDGDNDILFRGGFIKNSYVQTGNLNFSLNLTGLKYEIAKLYNRSGNLTVMGIGQEIVNGSPVNKFYASDAISFIGGTPDLSKGDIAAGDFNNDGLTDLLITGVNSSNTNKTLLYYQREDNQFEQVPGITLDGLYASTADWVDYDKDGDLDLLLSGQGSGGQQTLLYKNNVGVKVNTAPNAPSNLKVKDKGNGFVEFTWDTPTDDFSTYLGYNIRLGTSPGGSEMTNTQSNLVNGSRLITEPAPIYGNSYTTQLSPGQYYWSVQSIDQGFQGSPFAEEKQLVLQYEWKLVNQRNIIDRTINGVDKPKVVMLDYDNDKDLDMILGSSQNRLLYTYNGRQYLNSGIGVGNGGVENMVSEDINNDGWMDLVINSAGQSLEVYLNNQQGGFNYVYSMPIQSLVKTRLKVLDLDNDGLQEILILGMTSTLDNGVPKFYRLEWNGTNAFDFKDESPKIYPLTYASYDFGDFNNDSKIDLVISGAGDFGLETRVYQNSTVAGGDLSLTKTNDFFLATYDGTLDLVDYDGDSDLDIMITGTGENGDAFKIYQNTLTNNVANFSVVETGILPIRESKIRFGDFNGDGYKDMFYNGVREGLAGQVSDLVQYNLNTNLYEKSNFDYGNIVNAEFMFADIESDGDLDLVLAGDDSSNPNTKIFRVLLNVRNESALLNNIVASSSSNVSSFNSKTEKFTSNRLIAPILPFEHLTSAPSYNFNTPPATPGVKLSTISTVNNQKLLNFSWNKTTDDHTPANGLTYNLRVGTSPTNDDILAANANDSGVLKVPVEGNAEHNLTWSLKMPKDGIYYWSVQAVDASFAGSKFSTPMKVEIVNGSLKSSNAPTVVNGTVTIGSQVQQGAIIGSLGAVDIDADPLSYSFVSGNENGWFSVNASGQLVLAIKPNVFPGPMTLTITVSDGTSTKTFSYVILFCESNYESSEEHNSITKTYKSRDTLKGSGKITGSSNISMEAPKFIELKPGFVAEKGTVFRATIGAGCQ